MSSQQSHIKNLFLQYIVFIVYMSALPLVTQAAPFSPASGVIDPGQLTPAQQIEYGAPSCTPNDIDCYVAEKTAHTSALKDTLLTTIVDGVKSVVDLASAVLDTTLPNTFTAAIGSIKQGDSVLLALEKLQGTNDNQDTLISTLTSWITNKEDAVANGPSAQYFYNGLKGWSLLDTQTVPENGNLYFTEARVVKSILSGFNPAPSTPITAADSILEAFGKTQAQIDTLNATRYTNGLTNTGNSIELGGILSNEQTFIDGDGSESQLVAFGRNNTLKDFSVTATTGNKDGSIVLRSDMQEYLATDKLTLQETETGSFIKLLAKQKTGVFIGTRSVVNNTAASGQVLSLVNNTTGEVEFTTIPTAWGVHGNANTTPTNNFIGTLDLADLAFRTNNAEVMRITTSGNVGINQNSTTQQLHVRGSTATLPGTSGAAKDASLRVESSTGNIAIDSGTTINVGWLQARNKTNYGTQAPLLINPNGGNIGIYTGVATPGAYLTVGTTTTPSTNPSLRLQTVLGSCDHAPTGGTTELVTCSSDERLKSNITESKPVLDDINSFNIRQYTFNASGVQYDYGVIAQEVLTHHPDMVHMRDDGYYGVEEISVWKLVKGVQELFTLADSFKKNLMAWLADTANGIDTIATRILKTDSVKAKNEVCVGNTCITEKELQFLLEQYHTQHQQQITQPDTTTIDTTADPTQETNPDQTASTPPTDQTTEPLPIQ